MAVRNDFKCLVCGYWAEYWATRATAPSHCGQTMEWFPSRAPAVDAKEPFHQFDVDVNGERRTVGSLHEIRKIERQAEQQHRNGEGQPMVWRDYSQEHSNGDRHTLAKHLTRSMDTQDGYIGGVREIGADRERFSTAKGADVTKRQGTV